MPKLEECSALRPGAKCAHGFMVSSPCYGIMADTLVPICCDEEFCGVFYRFSDGQPPAHMRSE